MNIKGVRANLLSQGMKVLFSPLRVRKSYGHAKIFFHVCRLICFAAVLIISLSFHLSLYSFSLSRREHNNF